MTAADAPGMASDIDAAEDHTLVVDRRDVEENHELDEGTVVVDRAAPESADHTVVVDRSAPEPDDGTVVVDRSAPDPEDGTVVVDRSAPESDDGTLVVDRGPVASVVASSATPAQAQRSRSRRRRIALPPVEEGFAPAAVDAVGPGAVSSYLARPIAAEPTPVIAVELGADATRAAAPSMPSVVRRSRRMSLIGVTGFAATVLISVAGLTAIGFALLGG